MWLSCEQSLHSHNIVNTVGQVLAPRINTQATQKEDLDRSFSSSMFLEGVLAKF